MFPWLLVNDFNALLSNAEKKGGVRHGSGAYHFFNKFVNDYSFKDIDFQGSKFTQNRGSIFQRLDRALCNLQWESLPPNTSVTHFHKIKSDHRPLAINFEYKCALKVDRPFHFLSSWLTHERFGEFVKENWVSKDQLQGTITHFISTAKECNKEIFGNIQKKKRVLMARISSIQRCLK